ncbi:MAG: serine--tRNA ligase [DPANN group archaeon]|nr:serine--tRNA ligase [DPANN group archaeon]
MLDIALVRNNPEIIRNDLNKRKSKDKIKLLDEVIICDKSWRDSLKQLESLKHDRNIIALEISSLKKEKKDVSSNIKKTKDIALKIKNLDEAVTGYKERIDYIMRRLPNIMHESVPVGVDDSKNVPIKFVGKKREFDFTPKSHVDIIFDLGIADIERASKISGARFYFLKGPLALMEMALSRFAIDTLINKGFMLVETPFMMKREPYEGVTDLADFEDVLYKIEDEDLYLIATSEHTLTAQHKDEILQNNELPIKYAGFTTNFRKEVGSHGKDTKGIFRVHQFNKVEQVVLCEPKDSWKIHEELLLNAEELFKKLELPYRVVNICTGDLGTVAAKKYDIEVWMPVQNTYREVVSCSNCTEYQARRLNIRSWDNPGAETKPIHTLNSTAIATTRALVAIIENFQQKDGSIKVPKVLRPYMFGIKKIESLKKSIN